MRCFIAFLHVARPLASSSYAHVWSLALSVESSQITMMKIIVQLLNKLLAVLGCRLDYFGINGGVACCGKFKPGFAVFSCTIFIDDDY
jgi:hypothetical protein